MTQLGFPGSTGGKQPTCQGRRHKRCGFSPWVGKVPWRRAQQPTPVCLCGESHGQRSLATVHGVTKSQTQVKQLCIHACMAQLQIISQCRREGLLALWIPFWSRSGYFISILFLSSSISFTFCAEYTALKGKDCNRVLCDYRDYCHRSVYSFTSHRKAQLHHFKQFLLLLTLYCLFRW